MTSAAAAHVNMYMNTPTPSAPPLNRPLGKLDVSACGERATMSDIRALVLTPQDRRVVVGRLARAVLSFQDNFLSRESSPSGLLCQVWLPEVADGNEVVLKTKGMPFCVAGLGDLLALFRCISCRFAFGTDVSRQTSLGAPGRVYTSSEPEMCCNVQQYAKQEYLRKAEAQQCQVQSTLLLPLFISPRRSGCVGVLEVVQTSQDMAFGDVAALLAAALERCELYTCDMEAVKRRVPAMTTSTLLLPPMMGVLEEPPTDGETGQGASDGDSGMRAGGGVGGAAEVAMKDAPPAAAASRKGSGVSEDFSADEEEDDDDEEYSGARRRSSDRRGGASSSAGRPRRKGAGNPGKPGVRLTLADLQSQFGVGLKEAAARLGICPTTLKRACRRHGIQRWPRRQLQKVNRALDELEARQMLQPHQHLLGTGAAAAAAAGGGSGSFGPGAGGAADGLGGAADNRWTTLAHFMPAYNNTADTLQGYRDGQQQYQQGMLPYSVTVQQTDPGANQQVLQAAQQQLYMQQAAAAAHAAAAQRQAVAYAAAGGQPAASGLSLPDGALALGGGGGVLPQVPTMSGVSTLGQPPPQQQQQRGAAPPPAGPQAEGGQPSTSGNSSGAPKSAGYLQRVAATTNLVSPFTGPNGAAAQAGNPVVQLPGGLAAMQDTRRLSAISVPSVDVDVMPSLGPAPVMGDDEQVGFLDSSVLELLLTEEQRAGRANGGGLLNGNGTGNGGAPGDATAPLGSLQVPGMSGGMSGLSFLM